MGWLKLALPIALGLAAAFINYTAMNSGTKSEDFVRLKEDLKSGQRFSEENLERVRLAGDVGTLGKTAIRYGERTRVLAGRAAVRDLKRGDLILWRDILLPSPELDLKKDEAALPISLEGLNLPSQLIQVGDQVGFVVARPQPAPAPPPGTKPGTVVAEPPPKFETLGPFRVLSVGDLVFTPAGDLRDVKTALERRDVRSITIAMKRATGTIEDENLVELLRSRWDERGSSKKRIVEIVLLQHGTTPPAEPPAEEP